MDLLVASIALASRTQCVGIGFPRGGRHVPSYCFLDIAVEVVPVVPLKYLLADLTMLWVKSNFSLWMQLEITKHPVDLLKVHPLGIARYVDMSDASSKMSNVRARRPSGQYQHIPDTFYPIIFSSGVTSNSGWY